MARFRHHRWPLLTTLLLLIALSGLTACSTQLTTFEPRSDAAERTHAIYILLVVLASLVGAGVLAAMVYIMIRFRARPGRQASQTHGNTTIEIIWTIAPAGILLLIGVPSVLALIQANREPADDALRIEVTGHQWWWEVEYPGLGPDGGPLVTANELHIPVGQEITIKLESADVIHSFWVPQLVGKSDAIPGRTAKLEPFTAKEVGVFFGQCAEFCGTAHALMRFRVIVEPLADFERWMAALQETAGRDDRPCRPGPTALHHLRMHSLPRHRRHCCAGHRGPEPDPFRLPSHRGRWHLGEHGRECERLDLRPAVDQAGAGRRRRPLHALLRHPAPG